MFIEFLISFLISFGIICILNLFVVAFVILQTGYFKGRFWYEFKSDLKWGFTNSEILFPIIFSSFLLSIVLVFSSPSKRCDFKCEHCKGLMHEKAQNN